MVNWEPTNLGAIATFRTGKLDSNAAEENGLYPFFTCSPETYTINTYAFDTEAVLLAGNNANAVYPIKYFKGKFNAYQRTYVIEPKSDELADCRYLYYLILDLLLKLKEASVGSATKFLTKHILENFAVEVPAIEEQKAIAKILSSLDDKIELNRRMNETLEAMARALFKAWFVDFEPVHANIENRPSTSASPEIAKLFPSEFENGIPKGWRPATVGDFAVVIDCLHAKKPERQVSGRPYLQLSNILNNGLIDMSDVFFITEKEYEKWVSRLEASPGDCVITNVGRVGVCAQIPSGLYAALGRNMTGIRCKPEYQFPTFLIELMLSQYMADEIRNKTDVGTILNALNVKNIPKLRCMLPENQVIRYFETIARTLRSQMEQNHKENAVLSAVRDSLLPRLISGKMSVKEI